MNTIGHLIDQLTIVNLKIWHLEDIKRDSDDDAKVADACRKTNVLNSQRNELIEEIDNLIHDYVRGVSKPKQSFSGSTKIYGRQT